MPAEFVPPDPVTIPAFWLWVNVESATTSAEWSWLSTSPYA